jgi:hypothetical protein
VLPGVNRAPKQRLSSWVDPIEPTVNLHGGVGVHVGAVVTGHWSVRETQRGKNSARMVLWAAMAIYGQIDKPVERT